MDFISKMKSQASKSIKTIVLPESEDIRVLKGAEIVLREKFAKIILLGDEEKIIEKAVENDIEISGAKIINPLDSNKISEYADVLYDLRKAKGMTYNDALELLENNSRYYATMMVKCGDADGFVSGATHPTADTLRPALQIIKGAKGVETVSAFFIMQTRNYELGDNGVYIFADCGMVENPTAEQLSDIALTASQSYYELINDEGEAKVAMLSYSTKGSAKSDLTEKVIRATKIAQGKDPDLLIDGELQLDAAIVPEIQEMKAPGSPIKGNANILGYQQGNADTDYLIQRLEKVSKYGELAEQRVKKLGQAMDAVNEASGKNLSGATESQLKNVQKQVNSIQKAMSKLHNQGLIDDTQLQRSSTILTEIEKRIEDIRDPKKKNVTGFTEKMINDLEQLSNISGVASSEIQQYLDVLRNGDSTVQDIEAAIKGLNAALHENELNTRLTIQQFSQFLGALSSLYYAFNSLSNIGSIIKNDDLDRAEKFKQIIGSLVMGLPMLVTAISNIGVIKDVFTKMGLFISRFKSELSEYLIQMGKVGAATKVLKSLSEQEQKTLLVEAGVRNMNVKSLTAEEKIMVFNTAAKKGNKIANDALSKSNIKLRGTLEALKTVSPFGWISTAITAITLITTAVVKFRNEAQKATAQHRSDYAEKILEESKKASEALHQEYENTKTLVEEYKRLREEYTDPEDIDELRRRIYELSQQYGIHIDTLQLMTSNYEELDEMMNQLLADISGKQAAADLELINREIDALVAKMKSIQADNNHPFLNLFLQCQNITEIILEKVEEIIEKITGVEIPDWMRDFVRKPVNVGFGVSAANKNLLADSSETVQGVISVSNSGQLELDEEKFAKYSKEQKEEVKEWIEENYSENDSIWSGIMKIFDH